MLLLLLSSCGKPRKVIALDNGVLFLERIQREDGAICDTVNPLFDIWETVAAANALWRYYGDSATPSLSRAMKFLAANENSAGMLCHNRKCRASYCLETTSEYFVLLSEIYGKEKIQPRMDTLRKLQKPSGEWEIGNPDVLENKAFPSVTAFVLHAFQAAEMAPTYRDSAWAWLIRAQHPAGDWGAAWEYYGTTSYALWPALRTLLPEHRKAAAKAVQLGLAYIDSTQRQDGSWDSTCITGPQRPSKALQTALILNSFEEWENTLGHGPTYLAVEFLIDQQGKQGHWDGGFFPIPNARRPKQEYVFATAQVVMALVKSLEQQGEGS